MLITRDKKRSNLKKSNISLNSNDADLNLRSNEKVLGVNIDENLLWFCNVQYITKTISSHLWLLSQIKAFLSIRINCNFIMLISDHI